MPCDPDFEACADACKCSGGGWSTDLLFWWHVIFPDDIYGRACIPNNHDGQLISINILEMVCVIINLAAVIFFCDFDGVDLSTHPILSNGCDNMAACAWMNNQCKNSLIGREMGKFFIGLLMSKN